MSAFGGKADIPTGPLDGYRSFGGRKHHLPFILHVDLHVDYGSALFIGRRRDAVGVAVVLLFAFAVGVVDEEREPAVFRPPTVVRDLSHTDRSDHFRHRPALRRSHLNLPQLRDDTLGLVTLPPNRFSSLQDNRVDRFSGEDYSPNHASSQLFTSRSNSCVAFSTQVAEQSSFLC